MNILIRTAGAFVAVVAFSRLLELPRRFMLCAGLIGALNWLVYLLVEGAGYSEVPAAFFSSLAVAVVSHLAARRLRAPAFVFFVPGILPVVPGASIYSTVYAAIQNNRGDMVHYFMATLQLSGAIALGIFLADSVFRLRRFHEHRHGLLTGK